MRFALSPWVRLSLTGRSVGYTIACAGGEQESGGRATDAGGTGREGAGGGRTARGGGPLPQRGRGRGGGIRKDRFPPPPRPGGRTPKAAPPPPPRRGWP